MRQSASTRAKSPRGGFRFRPGVVPTGAMLVAVTVLGGLGIWQVRRMHWKEERIAEWTQRARAEPVGLGALLADGIPNPEALEFRRVTARGRYDTRETVVLMHVPRDRADGARVLTPLRLGADAPFPAVLVDRGWIPRDRVEAFLAEDARSGEVTVTGVLRAVDFGGEPGEPTAAGRRVRWNRLRPPALQGQLPYALAPFILMREDDGKVALPRGGYDPPRSRVDHRSYAITWFGMAALAVATWVAIGIQQGRESRLRAPTPPD